ncbi:MAG: ribonuclease HII [Clostridiaceae bacterium]|nr:ribonuclease HII [Clostridiaceae bacterium]
MKKMTFKSIKEKAETMDVYEAFKWLTSISDAHGVQVKKLADRYHKKVLQLEEENERIIAMSALELEAYSQGYQFVGGMDEAGRGPLAGPVVAACVILPPGIMLHKINDSKKLTPALRDKLFDEITDKAVAYGIGTVDSVTIDRINILEATKKAMELAIKNMRIKPDFLIIDAVELPVDIPQKILAKADEKSISVAAASILAKVTRDRIMEEVEEKYTGYGFAKHKGYGTKEHVLAIKEKGLCPIHRRSFTSKFV